MKARPKGLTRILALTLCIALTALFAFSAPASAKTIVKIAEHGWDSGQAQGYVAKFIIEEGLGYDVEMIPGDTNILMVGIRKGDIDVIMESWTENVQKAYDEGIAEGSILDLGASFPDSWQGFLVPTYMIEGDPERGIEPMAPDLKSVFDLPKYWELFKDPEDPSKGRFFSCIPGWGCEKINRQKIEAYGLDEHFNIFLPGSDAALAGSMIAAYKKGEPWFGYYWAPTWPLGKLDMTPLEEPPFDPDVWEKSKACAYPSVKVNILVHSSLPERAPEVVDMLTNYESTQDQWNKVLAYMNDTGEDARAGAMWYLKNYEAVWTAWVTPEVVEKVKAAMK